MRSSLTSSARRRLARAAVGFGLLAGALALPAVAGAAGALPMITVAAPTLDQSFNTGEVALTGQATDDGAVLRVDVSVRNSATLQYLQANGTWGSFAWLPAALSNPGTPSTTWTWTSTTLAAGSYVLLARAGDVGPGTAYRQSANIRFTVLDATGDASVPTAQRTVGGPLHAGFYSSGLELDPQGNIVIADTGNNQVAKIAPDGTEIWRVGRPGPDTGEFAHPRDVSVASDGRIFVMDTENERIVRLSPSGAWLGTFNGPAATPARFFLGGTVSQTAAGEFFYLADLGGRVRRFDLEGNQLQVFEQTTGAGGVCADLFDIRDAAADAAGNVYVAGYTTNTIIKYSPTGECLMAWGSTGSADGQFRTPYGVYVDHDPITDAELVYVTDAQNDRVQVFTTGGSFVGKFGEQSEVNDVEGTLYTLRRAAHTKDGSGDVWVADLWAFRLQRYDRTETGWAYAQTIGASIGTTTDTTVFHEPRGTVVDGAGNLAVMDTVHHQVVRFSPNGTIINRCGTRGDENGQFNWPRDVAIDQATGELWITDTKKNRLQVLKPNCAVSAVRGQPGTGVSNFNWPRAVDIRQSDRTAWFADTQNNRIVVWDVDTRTAVSSWPVSPSQGNALTQFNRPMGIAVNQSTGNIYVADTINNRIGVFSAGPGGANITLLRFINFGFDRPEAIAIAADGTTYVADTNDSEVVMLSPAGGLLATFGAADGLDHPAGLSVDTQGKLYVSDSFNDRVLVYSRGVLVPDDEAPDTLITSPAANATVSTAPITVTGTATDNIGVAGVRLAIRDNSTGPNYLWWNGTSWTTTASASIEATLGTPGGTSTTWSASFPPPSEGSYLLQAFARDATPNTDATKAGRTITYDLTPADTTAPNGTLAAPTSGQVLSGGPIAMSGSATDDVAVAAVRLSIRRGPTGAFLYWNGTAWVSDATTTVDATLAAPGTASTGWTYSLAAPAGGSYRLTVTAVDTTGNVDTTIPNIGFTYNVPQTDTTRPNGTLTAPTSGQVLSGGPIAMSGAATDDVGVAAVRLSIRRGPTGAYLYWNGTAWVAEPTTTVNATLAAPGTTSTGWTYSLATPVGGSYRLTVTAVDSSGNVDGTIPNIGFTYNVPQTDTTAPNGTLTAPTSGQVLSSGPIAMNGSATDDVAVAAVRLSIRRGPTGAYLYWNGTAWVSDSTTTVNATLAAPGTPSTGWTYSLATPVGGSYRLTVTAVDSSGNVDGTIPNIGFTYSVPQTDTTAPNGTLTAPTNGQVLTTAPITMSGAATDNVAVSSVRLSIRRGPSGSYVYWNGTSWVTSSATTVNATLAAPGTTSTTWTYALSAPVGAAYRLTVTAVDSSGNVDGTIPNVGFTYTPPADTVAPTIAIGTPTAGQVVPVSTGSLGIAGTAGDNVAVASVKVAIRKVSTTQYWNGTTWQTGFISLNATLASPGATNTTWSYTWSIPAATTSTSYALQVTSIDSSGRSSANATRSFTARG